MLMALVVLRGTKHGVVDRNVASTRVLYKVSYEIATLVTVNVTVLLTAGAY